MCVLIIQWAECFKTTGYESMRIFIFAISLLAVRPWARLRYLPSPSNFLISKELLWGLYKIIWAEESAQYWHILNVNEWQLTSNCVCACESLSYVWLFVTPRTIAHQAPLSMEFSRQEYCSGLPFPPPGDLPNAWIKPTSLALAGGFFTTGAVWEALSLPQCLLYMQGTNALGIQLKVFTSTTNKNW